MPSPFDITTATNTIPLDNKREGTGVFTVRNATRRRLRATARITTTPPEGTQWVTILPPEGGDPATANQRDFPIDSTQQIQVKIAVPASVPASTPPTSYTMKLTLADEINPDENFSTSQGVIFTVHEIDIPIPWWKRLPKWLIPAIIIAVLVIVVIIIGGIAISRPQPTPTATPIPVLQANLVGGNVALQPPSPICGQTFNVGFDVANLGSQPTASGGRVSLVDISLRDDSQRGNTIGGFPVIQPGQTFRVNMPLTIGNGSGFPFPISEPHQITLVIDPDNQIPETGEGDNTRIINYTLQGGFC
jgi:hypothetical protein